MLVVYFSSDIFTKLVNLCFISPGHVCHIIYISMKNVVTTPRYSEWHLESKTCVLITWFWWLDSDREALLFTLLVFQSFAQVSKLGDLVWDWNPNWVLSFFFSIDYYFTHSLLHIIIVTIYALCNVTFNSEGVTQSMYIFLHQCSSFFY